MATTIETLKKPNGDQVLPRTRAKAVSMEDGTTVEAAIKDINTAINNLPDISDQVNLHDASAEAHGDIRESISALNALIPTEEEKASWSAKSDFSGSYNDLTDKPTIPSVEGFASEDYVNTAVADKISYVAQDLTEEQQAQARQNVGAVSLKEVEELLGIEEEFSVTGELVEFNADVEEGTELEVISKIHRDETWGLSDKLVLHQVSGSNFVDFVSYLGGAGTVFEKDGLTATINADSTMTVNGTNEGTSNVILFVKEFWSGEHTEKVYPAGTYTIPKGFTMNVRAAQYPKNVVIAGIAANLSGTVTIPEPFRIIKIQYVVKAGATTDVTFPIGLFRGDTIPETGYEYYGYLHTVTFDMAVYDGEFNWTTGELKDADGNTVTYYESQPIKRLPGVNYFWTCFGENVVSNKSNDDLEKVVIRLGETAPAETVSSICDFTLTPTTPNTVYSLHSTKVTPGGTSEFYGQEIPLITTKGTVAVVDAQGKVALEKYVDTLINWQGTTDLLTNWGIHKVWSEKFYFTKEPIAQEDFSYDSGIANALYTFEFTEDDFQNTGLPAKLDNIPIVSPCFYTASDAASKLNERVWGGGQFPATLSWDGTSGKYIFKVRGLYPGRIMAQLQMYTKAYFHYQLETPYDEPATFAMGISSGDTVTFTVDDSDWKTYLDGGLYSINSVSADAMPTGFVYIPRNAVDACDGMVNAARILNSSDGSMSGDATVQGYSWIGEGDGTTDYTTRIQSKLDELKTVSNGGTINLGPGTYPISDRLIVYGNITIVGCGIRTVITQTADNTDALVMNGSNITLKDFCIELNGACTELTACVYVNSENPNGDNGYPSSNHIKSLTMDNIFMSGNYKFEYVDGEPVLGDVYTNYKGVGIECTRNYFTYAHVDNVHAKNLMTCVYGGCGSNYFNITSEFCKYGVYAINSGNNTFFVNGHSFYAIDKNGKHISMSDAIVYIESGTMSRYHLACYDAQAFRMHAFLGSGTASNKIDLQNVGSLTSGHEWNILKYFIVDYGQNNVYSDLYKNTPFHIGSYTKTISKGSQFELSNPVIQNVLSGAGIWGNISSNDEFENKGIALRDVCRYPSEKTILSNYLPFILSTAAPSEDNPIEIVIDYSSRPVIGTPNYFIQFNHLNVASDYVVSFDTTNTGVYDYEIPVTDNTNVVRYGINVKSGNIYTTYRMKFTFTKALQISDLGETSSDRVFDYNPDGLIGICNIGMTVNDYAGRSFLGECGGSLYGNVDMHNNTLKNLPNPVDDGDAVSKSYLESYINESILGGAW